MVSRSIKNRQVKRPDLARNAVNSSRLAPNSVTGADVANNSLTGADVDEASLDTGTLQARVTGSCPADLAVQLVQADGSVGCGVTNGGSPGGAAGGGLTGTFPSPAIAAGAVGTAQIADDSVTAGQIANVRVIRATGPIGVDDPQDTTPTDVVLVQAGQLEIDGHCNDAGGLPSSVTATIDVKTTGGDDISASSAAGSGWLHTGPLTLESITRNTPEYGSTAYSATATNLSRIDDSLSGIVTDAVHFGANDCVFAATALG